MRKENGYIEYAYPTAKINSTIVSINIVVVKIQMSSRQKWSTNCKEDVTKYRPTRIQDNTFEIKWGKLSPLLGRCPTY